MAGDLGSATAASNAPTSTGAVSLCWSPPELLDPEMFGSKRRWSYKKVGRIFDGDGDLRGEFLLIQIRSKH